LQIVRDQVVLLVLGIVGLLAAAASGCSDSATVSAPSLGISTPLPTSVGGETPKQGAVRLFEEARAEDMAGTFHPEILREEEVGEPQVMTLEYYPGEYVAQWILPNDIASVTSNMFEAMRPMMVSPSFYLVPIMYRGRCVDEFRMGLDEDGRWAPAVGLIDLTDPDAGGQLADIEQATAKLRNHLGEATEVRAAMFLPSGLMFNVGRNGDREAAVYITFSNDGPGVGRFDKYLPETGRLFTPAELEDLLSPE